MTDTNDHSAVPAPHVMVVGDVMVDVLVEVRAAFAHASDTPSSIATSPGGSAANQAVWLSRAGTLVALVACAGLDPFGDAAIAALESEGVDVTFISRVGRPTGMVVALVEPDGQRSMLTDRGANLDLGATEVVAALSAPDTVDHVHLSGYHLLDDATREAGTEAFSLAARLGATRSVDVSSAGPLRAMGPARFLALVAGCDYLFCNLEEGEALVGRRGPDEVLRALAASFGEVVLTLGADGAMAIDPLGSVHRATAATTAVADTVGAGDALAATYLAHRLLGADVATALFAAAEVSASAVGARGARRWSGGYSRA